MTFLQGIEGHQAALRALFTDVFAASEGPAEGRLIGRLVASLMEDSPQDQFASFTAWDGETLTGGIFFTRLHHADDPRAVWLLAPVAVRTDRQGQGVGQALLRYGLAEMAKSGAAVAITYGDPAYYGKVGFAPVSEAEVAAPYPLQFPEGWQAQSLTGAALGTLPGPVTCVPGFADPAFW